MEGRLGLLLISRSASILLLEQSQGQAGILLVVPHSTDLATCDENFPASVKDVSSTISADEAIEVMSRKSYLLYLFMAPESNQLRCSSIGDNRSCANWSEPHIPLHHCDNSQPIVSSVTQYVVVGLELRVGVRLPSSSARLDGRVSFMGRSNKAKTAVDQDVGQTSSNPPRRLPSMRKASRGHC